MAFLEPENRRSHSFESCLFLLFLVVLRLASITKEQCVLKATTSPLSSSTVTCRSILPFLMTEACTRTNHPSTPSSGSSFLTSRFSANVGYQYFGLGFDWSGIFSSRSDSPLSALI